MTNSADPDQLASDLDLHCLQSISRFSRTRVKRAITNVGTSRASRSKTHFHLVSPNYRTSVTASGHY